jgi:two-component system nitrogen regulation response regulator GlnG
VPVRLPPLRERTEDIPELVRHFFAQMSEEGLGYKVLDRAAMERLTEYSWPGNVRELENMVRRLSALYPDETIDLASVEQELGSPWISQSDAEPENESLGAAVEHHLSRYFAAHGDELPASGLYGRVLREIEKPLIRLTLQATGGNQIRAADLLGVNRNTLRKKIRDLEIAVVRGLK